jgi:hypothetical protein
VDAGSLAALRAGAAGRREHAPNKSIASVFRFEGTERARVGASRDIPQRQRINLS